jgi:hypothetical protein
VALTGCEAVLGLGGEVDLPSGTGDDAGDDSGSGGGSGSGSGSSGGPSTDGGKKDSGSSSGAGSGSSSGAPAVDAASCAVASSVPSLPTYTAIVRKSACSMAQVMGWASACDSSTATNATCNAWSVVSANVTCSDCIQPANSAVTGATIYDDEGNSYVNYDGCDQLVDGNSTCAAADYRLTICTYDACNSTACENGTQAAWDSCLSTAASGVCATENDAQSSACAADDADGGAFNNVCSTDTDAVYVICGNGK